jgi:hypothetical protein
MAMPQNRISVTIVPHQSCADDKFRLTLEFWNYFLDMALQEKLR